MLDFQPITIEDKVTYDRFLFDGTERGCNFTFANLYLWGHQNATIYQNHLVLFSNFCDRSVYPFPVGSGDKKPVLDAILADAASKNLPCRLIALREEDKQTLATLYPGQFRLHCDRDSYDYVYDIDALADLKGRKYHSKKNHYNRFLENNPDYRLEPINVQTLSVVRQFAAGWYETRQKELPDRDFSLEQAALEKALCHYKALALEGLVLFCGEDAVAFTIGSKATPNTFDVHFEKARADIDGAYTTINRAFANYIRNNYPEIRFLNREEDMGIEGLRKAKLSYHPHHMVIRDWACFTEEGYDDCGTR